jgi:hypothetical protein
MGSSGIKEKVSDSVPDIAAILLKKAKKSEAPKIRHGFQLPKIMTANPKNPKRQHWLETLNRRQS